MSKLQEFCDQLKQVDRQLAELEEFREDLLFRIDNELNENNSADGMFLNDEQLHKLLCFMENAIIYKDGIENECDRIELRDFREDLSYDIAEHFGYNLNEGSIDAKTYKYYTFNSRW